MMAGPNLDDRKAKAYGSLGGAAYLATCDPLDKGTHISPLFQRGSCALCRADPLATLEPLPETMLLECPPRVNGLW